MKTEYWQKGDALDYKNETTGMIKAGEVVKIQERIGIAGNDIPPGADGTIITEGCFKMPKTSGEEYGVGTTLYIDAENDCVTKESAAADKTAYTSVGYAAASAKTSDTYVIVKLFG